MQTIKRQTRAAYGCLVAGQSSWALAWPAAYRLYAGSICDMKAPLQLRYAACGATCYMPLPIYVTWWNVRLPNKKSADNFLTNKNYVCADKTDNWIGIIDKQLITK